MKAAKGVVVVALLIAALVFVILKYPLNMDLEGSVLWGLVAFTVVAFCGVVVAS